MNELTIRQIIEKILNGQLRVPAFQRGFVWDSNRVAYLMDSIYKRYPFGSILLWRTKESLKYERRLGPFDLPPLEPDYPLDYILDGQQRITSIFGVFQTDLAQQEDEDWMQIYYDYTANPDAQESQFTALKPSEFDPQRHFLLRNLFDTTAYRRATRDLPDDVANKIDAMQAVFKEARVPVQLIETEDRATVAIVFERVNQKGVELDTLQLLSAWTWSEDFDLQRKFIDLADDLKPFGFEDVGQDTNLLMRCISAVLTRSVNVNDLIKLNGGEVRSRFDEIATGVKGAVDFLRMNLSVYSLQNLPSPNILIPLTVFFSHAPKGQLRYTAEQKHDILKWFWRVSFTRRYNSQPVASLQEDIGQIINLKNGKDHKLGDFPHEITVEYFTSQEFRINTIASKTLILMLANKKPLSFISGNEVSLAKVLKEYNRNEFHHIFPQKYLKEKATKYGSNTLANLTFLSRSDNNQISSRPPSQYRSLMPDQADEILSRAMIPSDFINDNYDEFVNKRALLLKGQAVLLMERGY
ncbi:DUF262 domain-containing protein [Deinococcus metallilatus]|uniref:DUF262 domain-containing protein n=1 Tax=Deinococcus metallilatus TaxID=1211322 RepID=A0AAJ5F4A3_9DEIO|nr:DUF262 domain-containing protein [Deinococcus metallilatus]MBB5294543.1 hypothetical protein [Deinococcus metallilatus]QBY07588.1 DUF262 domain-containing protein [Deinococcus metallilatus]RXJ14004.1 DUF262 domain-containing protein [Deinococcus metallilatus]TLK29969.1 DUF262 domain-containing protein [Deinococcus metallilatus]GMA15756.1 hypothetical protein GCM10025871_20870 [Deinococcus metallilatus]